MKLALSSTVSARAFLVSERVSVIVTKLSALLFIALLLVTPLRIGTSVFVVGVILYSLGFALMVVALVHYRQTPMGEAVVRGVYRIWRNPQRYLASTAAQVSLAGSRSEVDIPVVSVVADV